MPPPLFHTHPGRWLGVCDEKNIFSYFSTKTYVMGAKKNRLNERVQINTKPYIKTDG